MLIGLSKFTKGEYIEVYYTVSRGLSGGNGSKWISCPPTTFQTYADHHTHSGGHYHFVWTPLDMPNMFWKFYIHSISQVSQFSHPATIVPLPQFSLFGSFFGPISVFYFIPHYNLSYISIVYTSQSLGCPIWPPFPTLSSSPHLIFAFLTYFWMLSCIYLPSGFIILCKHDYNDFCQTILWMALTTHKILQLDIHSLSSGCSDMTKMNLSFCCST